MSFSSRSLEPMNPWSLNPFYLIDSQPAPTDSELGPIPGPVDNKGLAENQFLIHKTPKNLNANGFDLSSVSG